MKYKKIQEKNKINLHLPNKKKVQKLKEQGITLIALVVTIIILLILAGVTISQIAGSNGLFQRARQAAEKYKNSAEDEQTKIGMTEQYANDFSVLGKNAGENEEEDKPEEEEKIYSTTSYNISASSTEFKCTIDIRGLVPSDWLASLTRDNIKVEPGPLERWDRFYGKYTRRESTYWDYSGGVITVHLAAGWSTSGGIPTVSLAPKWVKVSVKNTPW